MDYLNYIINNEHFIACPLIRTDEFIKQCGARGIAISRDQLEQFERLGLFYPLARVRHHQTYSWFRNDHAKILLEEGRIWDPALQPYQPWATFKDENEQREVENPLAQEIKPGQTDYFIVRVGSDKSARYDLTFSFRAPGIFVPDKKVRIALFVPRSTGYSSYQARERIKPRS